MSKDEYNSLIREREHYKLLLIKATNRHKPAVENKLKEIRGKITEHIKSKNRV